MKGPLGPKVVNILMEVMAPIPKALSQGFNLIRLIMVPVLVGVLLSRYLVGDDD